MLGFFIFPIVALVVFIFTTKFSFLRKTFYKKKYIIWYIGIKRKIVKCSIDKLGGYIIMNEKNSTNNKEIEEKKGDWKRYTEICDICQIDTIIGTCDHCGIKLYCSGEYPEFPCQFDIKVRRRQ